MSAKEMHVLGSQDEQDPPTITDVLRIALCTVLKSGLVMMDDHNGKILKYMSGHGGLAEDKNKRRGSEPRCMTRNGNLGGVPKKVLPCWCHSGTPKILPGGKEGPHLPGLSPCTHSA